MLIFYAYAFAIILMPLRQPIRWLSAMPLYSRYAIAFSFFAMPPLSCRRYFHFQHTLLLFISLIRRRRFFITLRQPPG